MPESPPPHALGSDELREHTIRSERHARALAERMMFLESVIVKALTMHSVLDRVCVCERCRVLRTSMNQNQASAKEPLDRSHGRHVSLPDERIDEQGDDGGVR